MPTRKSHFDIKEKNLSISDLSDLSMVDLIILQELMTFQKPIKRFTLYDKIRTLLAPNKKIFTSRFYTDLQKLEEKGFIKSNRNKKGHRKRDSS